MTLPKNVPPEIVIGVTQVPDCTIAMAKLPAARRIVDMFAYQNLARAPFGEQGICTGGYWEGFVSTQTRDGVNGGKPVFVVDPAKYRSWVATLPTTVKWLSLDIENNNGEFVYTDLNTVRAFRLLNAIALDVRPDLRINNFINAASLPYSMAGPVEGFTADMKALGAGTTSAGASVATHSLFASEHCIAGEFYPTAASTFDEIDTAIAAIAKACRSAAKPGQGVGLWITPMGTGSVNADGIGVNEPLPLSIMAHVGGAARRAGIDTLFPWGYQTDPTGKIQPPVADRNVARQQIFAAKWYPAIQAAADAFL